MNIIRNNLAIARKDLKVLFKDKGQLFVLFLLPFLLALFFGGSYATMRDPVTISDESKLSIKTLIVNQDQGPYGEQVIEVLKDIDIMHIQILTSVDKADKKVAAGEAPAALIIPADFSAMIMSYQPTRIELIKDPPHQVEARIIAGIMNEVLTELNVHAEVGYGIRAVYEKTGALECVDPEFARAVQAQTMGAIWTAVQEIRDNPAISVKLENLAKKQVELSTCGLVFSAFMPMFATIFAFFMVGSMAESILREKDAGSFRRLLAAPIHRGTVVSGKILAYIGVVFFQMLVLFGVCVLFFDMSLGESPLALFALTLALALTASSLGMLIGSVAQTSKQAASIGQVAGFVLFLASGVLSYTVTASGGMAEVTVPTEGLMYQISQFTPHTYAFNGYFKLFINGGGLADIVPNILVLLGFAAVFFLVAMWRFKYD
jgi:ABC-2 type transport system permease protein